MSNHFSAANLKSPGDDARLDLTDLFVFAAPDDPGQTVLIMNACPFTKGDGFHPGAVYRFNIDTDGDAVADVAFSFTFSAPADGRQSATAYYATGADARTREPRGQVLIQGTPVGLDAAANIFTIALQAPNDMLGPGPGTGTWITTSVRRDGALVPMDREGNPSFNPILNPNTIKDQFNATDPADDVTNYLQPLAHTLEHHGYPPGEATAAAHTLLPDILHYDRTRPAHYPNGRVMTDDVFSTRMIFMVHGHATPQNIGPHDDLTTAFPFLGPPHP